MKTVQLNTQSIIGKSESALEAIDANHKLHGKVKSAFLAMQEKASEDGVDIQICSSYRSFDKQLSIWNRKWQGQLPLYTLEGQQVNASELSDLEKIHAIMLWSALPGASRHHWGTDFDVYDKNSVKQQEHDFQLVPEEYETNGPCAQLSEWVNEHCEAFGFYLPYSYYVGGVAHEPWHLSYQAIARQIEKQFDLAKLRIALQDSAILGKATILAQLPDLVERYTFNRGFGEK